MFNRRVIILLFLLNATSNPPGYPQTKTEYPFVLNRPAQIGTSFYAEARFAYNCLRDLRVLTRNVFLEPVVIKDEPYYSYNILLGYKRIGIEIGKYFKKYPIGGIYSKGVRSNHTSINGYDESKAKVKIYLKNYYRISFVPIQRDSFNLGINFNFDFENSRFNSSEFIMSKNLNKFSYLISVELESYLSIFLYGPNRGSLSFSYNLINNISVFNETSYLRSAGDYRPCWINVLGFNVSIYNYLNIALYYQYFYDDDKKHLPYNRNNHRFGFQIMLAYK
jgi:hypothetical protein